MWIEISVVTAVVIFAILSVFIIRTLLVVQKSLGSLEKQVATLSEEAVYTLRATESRLRSVDPLLRTLSNLGEVAEVKSERLVRNQEARINGLGRAELSQDVLEWIASSAQLCQTLLKKRR